MASSITHAYFIMDVYDRLGIKSKELLINQKELLKVAAQNMDVLFFYNITNFKKGKKVRAFGSYFHQNKVYEFFSTLINYIKYNHYQYDPEIIAFLYGMLSHYVLDSTIHPYVIYKTGEYKKEDRSTYKYNHKHADLEAYFDNYLIRLKEGIIPHRFKVHQYCFNVKDLDSKLIEVMDFTYREVFGISNFHNYYLKSIQQMKLFFRIFRYDPWGLKKMGYCVIDFLCPLSLLRKISLSYHIKMRGKLEYLNLDHKIWYNPTDKRIRSRASLLDLYTKSLYKTVKMIQEINQFFYYDKKINLKKVIANLNYVTGRDCDKKRELRHFEF
ncbi:MAG: zinc dependent phospholipase C family protein [bacterium]|nr:zinc dependent phospholipase C family protein [bacterium]